MSVHSDHMMQFRRTLSFLGLAAGMIVLVGLVWIAYAGLQEQEQQRDEARDLREGLRTVRSFFSIFRTRKTDSADTYSRRTLLTLARTKPHWPRCPRPWHSSIGWRQAWLRKRERFSHSSN